MSYLSFLVSMVLFLVAALAGTLEWGDVDVAEFTAWGLVFLAGGFVIGPIITHIRGME
jgi:di/tricarboxylate transporter